MSKLEHPSVVLALSGVGCFALSFIAMGVAPWTTLSNATAIAESAGNPYRDEQGELTSVGRGRDIDIKEGCWHCHSQFVRPVAGEPYRYGPPSQAWESMFDVPQTFGTRRVGPDLAREAGRHPDDWHLAHLYNPRTTTPLSVMPGYPWLFDTSGPSPKPTQEALDVVAYMQALGKTYAQEIRDITHPRYFKVAGAPELSSVNVERGAVLFAEHCSGCHGPLGDGNGAAKPFLKPAAPSLTRRFVSPSEAYATLNRGVVGSAMPSFREMPERDLWALSHYVSTLGQPARDAALAAVAHERADAGATTYREKCMVCHGERGAGDGAAAAAMNPRPKDFTRRVFARQELRDIMRDGVQGSAMAPQGLSFADSEAVIDFITSLYNDELGCVARRS